MSTENNMLKYMNNVEKFQTNLTDISKTWDQLILFSQLGSTGIDMSQTKDNFNALTQELISNLANETTKKVVNEMKSKSQVAVDIVIRNLFERTADIGFLATDDDIRKFLLETPIVKQKLSEHKNDEDDTQLRVIAKEYREYKHSIKKRFEEYVAKYSVYYDIVLFDKNGNVIVQLDESNNIEKTNDDIINIAQNTTDDYVETYKYHDFIPQHNKSLVYTYKITKSNDNDKIIGYLSLCFKFKNEMQSIFDKLINKQNKEVILLLDSTGEVIATSDKYHVPLEAVLEIETTKDYKITQFAGRDYIVKTSKTNGYEGFFGLGWLGHIMIPLESVFNNDPDSIQLDENILEAIMENEQLFGKALLDIPLKAQHIQEELNRAVWNGNISQLDNKEGDGSSFARSILREVRLTGEKTQTIFNTSIENLNQTIITSLLENATFLSSLSIDIMDRNLYERANDVRWWALTNTFKEILSKDTYDVNDITNLTNILEHINELYTVYTNLFIYNKHGVVISVSNLKYKNLIGSQLSQEWVKDTLHLTDSSKYSVSKFEKSFLYDNQNTYIYGASISDTTNTHSVGGIGIVFDSKDQFQDMLQDALPQENGKIKDGIFSLFVERNTKQIISCSDTSHTIGETIIIDDDFFTLNNAKSLSKIIEYKEKYYIVGASCSSTYREYKNTNDEYTNDVISFVFIEAGDIDSKTICQMKYKQDNYFQYQINQNEETQEIATFYIDNRWLGIKASDIVEAISIDNLEKSISLDTEHHFKGSASYKNYIVSVLDISKFIKSNMDSTKNDIIIVKYEDSYNADHTIGIVVEKLGEIIKVPTNSIKKMESHLIGGGMLAESIVQPPEDSTTKSLLTLLNISKISTLKD